jgi:hypothetical protein
MTREITIARCSVPSAFLPLTSCEYIITFLKIISIVFTIMSAKISTKLQDLINQANNRYPSTGEAITATFKQALNEGYPQHRPKT